MGGKKKGGTGPRSVLGALVGRPSLNGYVPPRFRGTNPPISSVVGSTSGGVAGGVSSYPYPMVPTPYAPNSTTIGGNYTVNTVKLESPPEEVIEELPDDPDVLKRMLIETVIDPENVYTTPRAFAILKAVVLNMLDRLESFEMLQEDDAPNSTEPFDKTE